MKIGIDYIGITTPFYCINEFDEFFLHKRSEKCRDEHLKWDFGAGKLEFGENIEQGVLRELKEEYGCEGVIVEQLPAHSIIREFDKIKSHWVAIPFIIKVKKDTVTIQEPNKILEIGWFKINSLPKPMHSGAEYTVKQYKDIFAKYS